MHILLDDLGDGFITFPEFVRQLRDIEQAQAASAQQPAGCGHWVHGGANTFVGYTSSVLWDDSIAVCLPNAALTAEEETELLFGRRIK